MKQELSKAREEVSYHKYPEELLNIRNKLIGDTLADIKEKPGFDLPEGLTSVTESAAYIGKRLLLNFSELKSALESKNESLISRIKNHISQVMALTFRICEFRQKGLNLLERCKLINTCIVVVGVISKQVSILRAKY